MRRVILAVLFAAVSASAFAQGPTNSGSSSWPGYQLWPQYPPVGIGTEGYGGPVNAALQLHYYDSAYSKPAVLRFSQGGSTNTAASGVLALIPTTLPCPNWLHLSSLVTGQDFVIRANHGDLILTNNWRDVTTGAIRMATRPLLSLLPPAPVVDTDYEHLTILGNGNVGIDVPHDSNSAVATPKDQLQIGGGSFDVQGSRIPGLTIYGGNQFEGMDITPGHPYPVDWRYIYFNGWTDHWDTTSNRFHRFAPIGGSGIAFSNVHGGLIRLHTSPKVDTGDDFEHGMTFLMDSSGLGIWSDQRLMNGIRYHHLIDIWKPDSARAGDSSGMFFHHTPVYIGTSWYNWASTFNGFSSYHTQPSIGGTWMLAVEGAALFKEAYVSTDWADYVFDPSYKLRPLPEVEQYIAANHHLPDVPSADEIKKSGVPLGMTEARSMQKIEELTLYVIELQKQIEELKSQMNTLKQGGK